MPFQHLYVVRHAEADHHLANVTGGWSDSGLTAQRRRQAEEVAVRLTTVLRNTPCELYSSDLRRALDTAAPIAAGLALKIQVSTELRELSNGLAANQTKEVAESLYRPATHPALDWVPYEQGESWRMLHERVARFMERLALSAKESAILVTHGNTTVCILNWFLGLVSDDAMSRVSYDIDPGSITHLRVDRHGANTISRLNDVRHLDVSQRVVVPLRSQSHS